MKIRFTALLLVTGLFLLTACGQKGPLYHKNDTPAVVTADENEASKQAAESKTEDNTESDAGSETETTPAEPKSEPEN